MRNIHGDTIITSFLSIPQGTFVTIVPRQFGRRNFDTFLVGRVGVLTPSGKNLKVELRTETPEGKIEYSHFGTFNHYGNSLQDSNYSIDIVFASESECNAYVETKRATADRIRAEREVRHINLTNRYKDLGKEINQRIKDGYYQTINFNGLPLYVIPISHSYPRFSSSYQKDVLYIVSIREYKNDDVFSGFLVNACRILKSTDANEINFSIPSSIRNKDLDIALGEALEP